MPARHSDLTTDRADPAYWAKMAYWDPADAAALSLGYDLTFVNANTIEPYVEMWSDAKAIEKRLTLISRAVEIGQVVILDPIARGSPRPGVPPVEKRPVP